MAYFDILPDLRRKRLIWPSNIKPHPVDFAKKIKVSLQALQQKRNINPSHQLNVHRRDCAFKNGDIRREDGRRSGKIAVVLLQRNKDPIPIKPQNISCNQESNPSAS
ncbi:hypothetical protein K3495_g9240 [Podosphaera aphanis]|nr:hypothetical protein K3495_g9240 [Podosphaera aphanis]